MWVSSLQEVGVRGGIVYHEHASTSCWTKALSEEAANNSWDRLDFNPFPAEVAIKRHLGIFATWQENWSDLLVWPNDFSLTWGVYIANRRKEHWMFSKSQ
jgi:hypothetical protein